MGQYDEIRINELRVYCTIGVSEEERSDTQEIMVTVSIFADLSKACKSDNLEDTIDYSTTEKEITELAERSSYFLIEHLAERIAEQCLRHPKSKKVEVTIEKPGALTHSTSAGVRIVRENIDA
jgi:FolB domain-containing protein